MLWYKVQTENSEYNMMVRSLKSNLNRTIPENEDPMPSPSWTMFLPYPLRPPFGNPNGGPHPPLKLLAESHTCEDLPIFCLWMAKWHCSNVVLQPWELNWCPVNPLTETQKLGPLTTRHVGLQRFQRSKGKVEVGEEDRELPKDARTLAWSQCFDMHY